jgi:hypothetical protein
MDRPEKPLSTDPAAPQEQQQPSTTSPPSPPTTKLADLQVEVVETILFKYLLPDFRWEAAHPEAKFSIRNLADRNRRIGPTARERMEHAAKQWQGALRNFANMYQAAPMFRAFLVDPRTRIHLYRIWLGQPLPHLWDPGRHDPETARSLDADRVNVGLVPSDLRWRKPLDPGVGKGRTGRFDYQLSTDWYETFMADAYANNHLRFVTFCSYRANLKPERSFRDRMENEMRIWPKDDPAVQAALDPGPNPGLDEVEAAFVFSTPYDRLMMIQKEGMRGDDDDADQVSKQIDQLDRMAVLAPGVHSLLVHDRWHLELSDDPTRVWFPGAEILRKRNWKSKRAKSLLWLRFILSNVAQALAQTTVIRVPRLRIYISTHFLWSHELLPKMGSSLQHDPLDPNWRAGVYVLSSGSKRRRRMLWFNPTVRSVARSRLDLTARQAKAFRDSALLRDEMPVLQPLVDKIVDDLYHMHTVCVGAASRHFEADMMLQNVQFGSLDNLTGAMAQLYRNARPPPPIPIYDRAGGRLVNKRYPARTLFIFMSTTLRYPPLTEQEKADLPPMFMPKRRQIGTGERRGPSPYEAVMERLRPTTPNLYIASTELQGQNLDEYLTRNLVWTATRGGGDPLLPDEMPLTPQLHVFEVTSSALLGDGDYEDDTDGPVLMQRRIAVLRSRPLRRTLLPANPALDQASASSKQQ